MKRHAPTSDEPSTSAGASRPKKSKSKSLFDDDGNPPAFIPELYKKEMYTKKIPTEPPDPDFPVSEIPSDTKAAILHIRQMFPMEYFHKRIPPVILQSQLSSIIDSTSVIDSQLRKLVQDGEVLIFSNDLSGGTSNFIVLYEDLLEVPREGIFHRFMHRVLAKDNLSKKSEDEQPCNFFRSISKDELMKKWKFRENEVRQLVNSGYLGIDKPGSYCLSLPGAGQFVKAYVQGDKNIRSAIKRAKYGEVLQNVSYFNF